ncbi:MAG: NAD(P)-dependent alcohol dehydrogenase [Saprospiraceae bacterium]|nr:NAD(P)-dependent alcohol dehydrogenase [Saprospiraceae bacterium]
MRAIVSKIYGSPKHVMHMQVVEEPVPKENEVLIRVQATTVNDYDWSLARGKPYLYRLMFGLLRPKYTIFGMELSGIVEETGISAKKFVIGDEVFGDISDHGFGTFAEYVCVDENVLRHKPLALSFEEAASIPHAALLALQSFKIVGNLQAGQQVLINGAGGGVGVTALYLATMQDCVVTGVDSADKLAGLRQMGYDHVIDYRQQDFTKNGKTYDVILDCKTNRPPWAYLRSLKKTGTYITVGGKLSSLLGVLFFGRLSRLFSEKGMRILALKPNDGLEEIVNHYVGGDIKCLIDGPYTLDEVPDLVEYFGLGKHKGKIVVKVS